LRQQQQPKQEIPDIFENPQGFQSHLDQIVSQKLREQEVNLSFRFAHREYKAEFEDAYASLQRRGQSGDVATVQSIMQSPDPGEAMMKWHRQQKLYETTGGDLDGYLAKRQEEMLKDPAFLAKAVEAFRASQGTAPTGQRPASITQLPPSLSRVASSAPAAGGDNDMSDAALFAHATR
jgi:hypothetical protein